MTQTGPRSLRAKRRVSTNAVKHGLRSTKIVIPGLEKQADWDQFFNDAIDALSPDGAIEYALAERIATLLWRLRRVVRAERDSAIVANKPVGKDENATVNAVHRFLVGFRRQIGYLESEDDDRQELPEVAKPQPPPEPAILPVPLELQSLSKYEYRQSRQLLHTMHELWALQDRRRGHPTPLALDEGPNDA